VRVRAGNVLVVALGGAALLIASWIAWRGRRLPVYEPRELPSTPGASALDALRTISAIAGAGAVAGFLVAGLGGRLFMRVMAATSGNGAQGKLTEAEEVVGDITFDGSLGFVIFIGIFFPAVAALAYIGLRHFLPNPAALGGAIFGVILLGTLGVGDPMSSDNVDFEILEPLALAVAGVTFLALLFGVTFAALATRFDAAVKPLSAGPGQIWKHVPLVLVVIPPIAVIAVVYVLLRVVLHGRTRATLDGPVHKPGMVVVGLGALAAGVASIAAAISIL
jgi:hypothetical protein